MESRDLFAAASWIELHGPLIGPFRLVQKNNAEFSTTFPYRPKRTGAPRESDAAAKKTCGRMALPNTATVNMNKIPSKIRGRKRP